MNAATAFFYLFSIVMIGSAFMVIARATFKDHHGPRSGVLEGRPKLVNLQGLGS